MTWKERIAIAKERHFFTEEDKQLVAEWPTDPCGERAATLPRRVAQALVRDAGGAPYNEDLKRFCWEFQDAVERDEPFLAGELAELIDKTIDRLIGEIK